MKFLVLIGYAMVFLSSFGMSDLQTFRHNYGKVVSDKMLCEEMLKDLEKEKNIIYGGPDIMRDTLFPCR